MPPAVDFSNPFLRAEFPRWLRAIRARLRELADLVPVWARESRAAERARVRAAGAPGARPLARPLALVVDVDEVLLCNLHHGAFADPDAGVDFHVADFFSDPATGDAWGRDDPRDPPLPGALGLLRAARAENVAVFFVTGRREEIRAITAADFRRAGFVGPRGSGAPLVPSDLAPGGRLVMLPAPLEPGASVRPFKEGARGRIEKTHRIIANIGDQASDLGRHGDVQVLCPHPFYFTP